MKKTKDVPAPDRLNGLRGRDSTRPRFDDLPDVLTTRDLMAFLPFGRDTVYAALENQTIRNRKLGQKYVITKAAVREFLEGPGK